MNTNRLLLIYFISSLLLMGAASSKSFSEPSIIKDKNNIIDISDFPKQLKFSTPLSDNLNFLDNNFKVEVTYFKKGSNQVLFEESFKNTPIIKHKINLTLGNGKQKWLKKYSYSSFQELIAYNPQLEIQIKINDVNLYPKIGFLPEGHSQETASLLESKKQEADKKHWKGFTRKSTISTFQAVSLSSEIYTSADNVISHPFQINAIGPKLSQPLINLKISEVKAFDDEVKETNKLRHEQLYDQLGRRFGTVAPTQDDILAIKSKHDNNSYSLKTPAPSGGFEGMPRIDGVLPPDIEAAVGPNHIVQMVNSQLQIFNKAGATLAGPSPINDLWNGFGGRCDLDNDGDPIALYDEQADRFVLTQFAVSGAPESVCFAVSTTPDPTGTYNLYQIVAQRFPDYYKLGVWPVASNNAYFMGTNSGQPNQYDVYAIDRENMLLGNALRPTQFFQGFQNLLIPADADGELPPPVDEPGYFYTIRDSGDSYFNPSPANDSLDIYSFNVDWTTPANSTFTLQAVTSAEGLADFNWTVCGWFVGNCLEQPTSAVLIDSNSWWPQQRFQYRNFGIYGSLVGAWGVNAVASPGKHTAPRWFEFRKYSTDLLWTLRQQGTYAPDSTHRFSPSISMDESQNIGLGYSTTSSVIFPSIKYTIHDNHLDDLGEMESEATMKAGGGSQTNASGRWGDYASMDIDPSDDCTFWHTTEYIAADTNADWKTYIGSFKVPGCKRHNILLFDDYTTAHEINVCKADNTTSYDLALSYDFNTPTNMSVSGCPAGATCNYSANPITYPTTTALLFSNLAAAATGSHPLVITATDGGSKTDTENLSLNLYGTLASSPSLLSPSFNGYSGSVTPNLSWSNLSGAQNYTVEVDDDPGFTSIDFSSSLNGLTNIKTSPLATESCYYWRVTPSNLCGVGPVSAASTFYTPGVQNQTAIASTNVPITIPATVDPTNHFSTLTVAGIGVINDVNLLNLDITHSYVGDLEVVLTSPQGTTVVLMSQTDTNAACAGNNNVDISLDDEGAAGPWPCSPMGNGGTYQPSNPLAAFDGENADGVWTLNVKDPFNGDGGSLNGWSLEFQNFIDTGNYCPLGFSVGGTVSGLSGSGLVLQNNFGDNLPIAADGSFTFATLLDDLDPYSVTILTQPSSPNQTCSITNETGFIAGSNINNISITCPEISFTGSNLTQDVCVSSGSATDINPITLTTSSLYGFNNNISLAFNPASLPTGISGGFSNNNFIPVAAPGTDSILNLSVNDSASSGVNSILVEASGTGVSTKSLNVDLNVIFALSSSPTTSLPLNGSTGVATNTSFSWATISGADNYVIDITTDPTFNTIDVSAMVATTSYTPAMALSNATIYYWRVRAVNTCGESTYTISAFETAAGSGTATTSFCSNPSLGVSIPDNNLSGVDNVLNIVTSGTITDINISVDISHTWVGDLIVEITSPATTSVTILDRPGYTGAGNGCNRNDIDAVLDDEAATAVEGVCPNATPTINGQFIPNNSLTLFDAQELSGNWSINVADVANGDFGTINQWCVEATYDTGAGVLNPADFSDLNNSYGIAKHEGGGTSRLGSNWTADSTFSEDGDSSDDDGINASGMWVFGSSNAELSINSTGGYVACWFDWNNDGTFEPSEQTIAQNIVSGTVDLAVTIPSGSTFGTGGDDFLETRCRFYTTEPTLRSTETPIGLASTGEVEDYKLDGNTLTPVTMAYSKGFNSDTEFNLNWSTSTESGTVGYNVYGFMKNQWTLLNKEIISAKGINSTTPNDYQLTFLNEHIDSYKIEELTTLGTRNTYGPYQSNRIYGKKPLPTSIDWHAINQQSQKLAKDRQTLIKSSADFIKVNVSSYGIQRITYEDLMAIGINWQDINSEQIAITFENQPIARKVSDSVFTTGSYIDFIGFPATSLYTNINTYELKLNSEMSKPDIENSSSAINIDESAYYIATARVDDDINYSFASPSNSPWFFESMLAFNNEVTFSHQVSLPNLIYNDNDTLFEYSAWGGTDWPQFTDHHLKVFVNNQIVSEKYADGINIIKDSTILNNGLFLNSTQIDFKLPGDTGVDYDLIQLDYFAISYPAKLSAIDDQISFNPLTTAKVDLDELFKNGFELESTKGLVIDSFSSDQLIAYATNNNELISFSKPNISSINGFQIELPFVTSNSKYYVAELNKINHPSLSLGVTTSIDTSKAFDYLMISHPDFINSISTLVDFHESNGTKVLLVNVEDIYALKSHHRKDAYSIKEFIKETQLSTGIQSVLLVGNDSYDYKNNLSINSISYIPTLYYPTDDLIKFSPVDSLFVDIDNNLTPDLAIGRLPVRTIFELENIINKIINFDSRSYKNTAIFSTDRSASFDNYSNQMISLLPSDWQVTRAYINELELSGAQSKIFQSINSGVSLTSFFGHSGPTTWSAEHLFDTDDIQQLDNIGKPTIVNQYGCWNTYYVVPQFNTMSHYFMSEENKGAVAVLGASTLTESFHESMLGNILTPMITEPNRSIGDAIKLAKQALAENHPGYLDTILGWNLLGDPLIILNKQ